MPYFIDHFGNHLGFFIGSAPANGIEVPVPKSIRSIWNGTNWEDPTVEPVLIPISTIVLRLLVNVDLGNIKTAVDSALNEMTLEERDYVREKLASMNESISSTDSVFRQLLTRLGANPDNILVP